MGERCEALDDVSGPCRANSAGQFTRACEHEHIRVMRLCKRHVAKAAKGRCRDCSDRPDDLAHHCPITLTPVPAEAASGPGRGSDA